MKDSENQTIPDLAEAVEKAAGKQAQYFIEVDVDRYQGYLDDPALSPDQRAEIIKALWTMMSAFVEMGFGVHPVQQACGKHRTELDQTGNSESTGVEPNNDKQHRETDAPAI